MLKYLKQHTLTIWLTVHFTLNIQIYTNSRQSKVSTRYNNLQSSKENPKKKHFHAKFGLYTTSCKLNETTKQRPSCNDYHTRFKLDKTNGLHAKSKRLHANSMKQPYKDSHATTHAILIFRSSSKAKLIFM